MGWVILIFSLSAHSEYRAYQLAIARDGNTRLILTNFDQYQYPEIYPLEVGENISYLDSWMCWGRQGVDIPLCPNPRENIDPDSLRAPASD